MEFYLDMIPPTVTAQEHKVAVRYGKPYFYDTAKLKAARKQFLAQLIPYKPDEPLEGPVYLAIEWNFFTKTYKDGSYRITRPDTDNLTKLLKDCMTAVGFWKDDSQVCREKVVKRWARISPGISIKVEEINEP